MAYIYGDCYYVASTGEESIESQVHEMPMAKKKKKKKI